MIRVVSVSGNTANVKWECGRNAGTYSGQLVYYPATGKMQLKCTGADAEITGEPCYVSGGSITLSKAVARGR